ncbi:MAG: YggT family protein [Gammaproteobacteria bacterium]|nr:MAG: YggT family protein [Gammaproteobacteria bacterium]
MIISSGSSNILIFLINTLSYLFVMALLLRFLTQLLRGDYYNPITQFIVKITQPVLNLVNRFIPRHSIIDLAAIFLAIVIIFLKILSLKMLNIEQYSIVGAMISLQSTSIPALLYLSMLEIIDFIFDIFFFAIVIQAIMSWLNPATYNPMVTFLEGLTYPILNLVRRFIPDLGGIDLSPILAILLLQIIQMIIFPALIQLIRII